MALFPRSIPYPLRTMLMVVSGVFITVHASAQLGVRVAQFRPYGVLGEVVEKKITFELMFIDEFEDNVRTRFSFGYHKFSPRMDVFPTVGYGYEDGQWTVYPGTLTYTRLDMLNVSAGIDYAPFKFMKDRLAPYVGAGCVGGMLVQDYENDVTGLSKTSDSFAAKYVGVQARVGIEMAFTDHIGAFLELTSSWALALDAPNMTFAQPGLGVRYIF